MSLIAIVACRREAELQSRENALRHDLFEMRKAIDDFHADQKRYPKNLAELQKMKYVRRIPKDPLTNKADWVEIDAGRGEIYDVRSAAPAYSKW